ncbi:MAG: DNA polymerase I [Planctomycetota bacterium]
MNKKFFVIDGYSYLYQAFYAIRGLTGPKGEPTNAVYGFISMILRLMEKEKPEYIAITFDLKEPSFRHKEYKDYKANRKPMPEELIPQVETVKEIAEAYRIPVFNKPGYEADDIIGTIVASLYDKEIDIFIITRDKDIKQLLNEKVVIYDTKKGDIYNISNFREEFGFEPQQLPDYLALAGDSSDNIPGVNGIGAKTAKELIVKHGTVENILKNPDSFPSKSVEEKIKKDIENAKLSKHLACIKTDVQINFDLSKCSIKEPDREKLVKIFQEHGMTKFIEHVISTTKCSHTQTDPSIKKEVQYTLINSLEKLQALLPLLSNTEKISVDTETTGEDPFTAELVGISLCIKENEAYYIPVRAPIGEPVINKKEALSLLSDILTSDKIRKIGQNLKYDAIILHRSGINLSPIWFDTMIAAYLLDPEAKRYGLNNLALKYLGLKKTPIEALIGKKGKNQISIDRVPSTQVCTYSCQDADFAFRLHLTLSEELKEKGLESLFRDVEMPIVSVLVDMEKSGISIDSSILNALSSQIGSNISEIEKEIYSLAEHEFNIDSPKQLSKVLFEELMLSPKKKTTSGQLATDQSVLEELAHEHPLPAKIVEYRKLAKLKSTYLDALPKMISPYDGRVHTSFNQTGTATGRLSSSNPNLQNIPIKEELGREIRRAFVTRSKDYIILASDYSQIELRLLAHFSGDSELVSAFQRNEDIHASVASNIYHVSIQDVTSAERSHAKAVNFGIVYGLSPHGLSVQLGISHEEAKKYIDEYFNKYNGVATFIEKTISQAHKNGYVTTILNRRRYIPGIRSDNKQQKAAAERLAVNTVLQGSAADMIKTAMIRIQNSLRKSMSTLILQIHDELVFEIYKENFEDDKNLIMYEMENAIPLIIPVKVNIEIGSNWFEAK